jgi:ribA/ribD-fused uncharacterized protein
MLIGFTSFPDGNASNHSRPPLLIRKTNMSDQMYFEAPNEDGSPYKSGDWRRYALYDEFNIKGFFGEYRYLSNFYACKVRYEGLEYPSSETAYQAAKVVPDLRSKFQTMTDTQSKRAWKLVGEKNLIPDWDNIKYSVMQSVVFDKFLRNLDIRQKLIETISKYLQESNHWGDCYWGYDIKSKNGYNHLGQILMATRAYFWICQ